MTNLYKLIPILIVYFFAGCATISNDGELLVCHLEEIEQRKAECEFRNLSPELRQLYTDVMNEGLENILVNYTPPKYDGGKYNGAINFCLNKSGGVESAMLSRSSGHTGLDVEMMKAIKQTKQVVKFPDNECLSNSLYFNQVQLDYDHNDMQK